MQIYTIYKSTNKINGCSYIGFDKNWPARKRGHKSSYKKQNRNSKFYNAIQKYGWDNFVWEVIYQSKDGEHTLNVMEPFFIKENNSFKKGLNSTLGGEGTLGRPTSKMTKSKIGKALKGKPKSISHIQKMSETRKGIKPSEDSLRKRSESMKRTLALKKLSTLV